jgi:hypothetical protein
MHRLFGTTRTGHAFSQEWINAVWNKATIVPNYDSSCYRKDACGAWIEKTSITFSLVLTKTGWKVSDIKYADGRRLTRLLSGK